MNIHRLTAVMIVAAVTALPIVSQEALKSTEEEYYDFLSIQGLAERPTLNYRTLSDSEWKLTGEAAEGNHVWAENNLGTRFTLWQAAHPADNWFTRGIDQSITMKVYGPEWFNSFNTAAPYGQNDGALWQGRGYNTSLTGGIRFEAYGFEATIKPQLSFSQNMAFEYITPNYAATDKNGNQTIYAGKASEYGYYGVQSIDAPQRFGDKLFFTYDWGDTEIRWSWHTFTVGFGTQSIWLGPANLNPIIHSNNAASYPKFDIGLRKQSIVIPKVGWYLGDIEFRGWWGQLSESDYFDTVESNNHNLISGLAVSWALPGIFEGLSIGFNRTMLSKWNNINAYSLFEIFIPLMKGQAGQDESDQRASITVDYLFPKAGVEIYLEWGRNDFQVVEGNFLRYPFHSQGWTVGGKKTFNITQNIFGILCIEITNLQSSYDYGFTYPWQSTFYAHHKITQGYTNRGQWLGAGVGTGSSSQYINFSFFYPQGCTGFYVYRVNPNLDYIWFSGQFENTYTNCINTEYHIGINSLYYITDKFFVQGGIEYIYILSPNYTSATDKHSISGNISLKFII